MTIKFADNYNLFVIYLILNLSGYDDENNKEGMHPTRKEIRSYFKKYKKNEIAILSVKKLLKKIQYNKIAYTGLLKRERPRVRKFQGINKELLLIKKFEKSAKLKEFYVNYYLPNLKNIIDNKKFKQKLNKYEKDISSFVEIKTNWRISVVINLLDAYWRGNNYRLSENYSIITTGPDDKKDVVNWHNIVHETLHCILRVYFKRVEKNFSARLIKIIKQKTLDGDYKNNTAMHQIEEAFVRGFTPLVLGENSLSYWNYLKNKFPLSEPIYRELEQKLVKGKIKFNQKILEEIIKKIENV